MFNSPTSQALNNIEKVLINDEIFMRLLKYEPEAITGISPLDTSLPNVVDDSQEYWDLVEDRFRRGSKRNKIDTTEKVIVYMYEGRRKPIFGNFLLAQQEIRFNILIHEIYENDNRMAMISDRLSHLLMHSKGLAGIGMMRLSGSTDREAPLSYRGQIDSYVYTTSARAYWSK